MAVYDRNQGLVPTTSQGNSSLLPSKDIGSVIVRSLQNALNASGDNDDDLPEKIAEGINSSDLVKGSKGGVAKSNGGTSKSPIDNLLEQSTKRTEKSQDKFLKRQEDAQKKAKAEWEKRDQELGKMFDTAMRGISTFAQNPLKGIDNALQAGLKGAFKGFGHLFDGKKEQEKKKQEAKEAELKTPDGLKKTLGESYKDIGLTKMAELLSSEDKVVQVLSKGLQSNKAELAEVVKNGVNSSKLFSSGSSGSSDAKKEDKDKAETKAANIEKKRDSQHGDLLKSSQGTNMIVGMIAAKAALIVAAVAGIVALLPILVGNVAQLLLGARKFFTEFPIKIGNLGRSISTAFSLGMEELTFAIAHPIKSGQIKDYEMDNEFVQKYNEKERIRDKYLEKLSSGGTLSEDEQKEYDLANAAMNALSQRDDVKDYLKLIDEKGVKKHAQKAKILNKQLEAEAYDDLYMGMAREGKLTEKMAADAIKSAEKRGDTRLIKRIEEFGSSTGFAKETGLEAAARKGAAVRDAYINTAGELAHDSFVSTTKGYERINTYGGTVNNVNSNTSVTVTQSPNMGSAM